MNKAEKWLPVVDWEDLYEVSDMGRVRSRDRIVVEARGRRYHVPGRILRPTKVGDGYASVCLCRNNSPQRSYVHHLVLHAFAGPRPPGMEACHGPSGKEDNRLANLYYGTGCKNRGADKLRDGTLPRGESNPAAKLTESNVLAIRASGDSGVALAKLYGVNKTTISAIRKRRTWAYLTS